MFTRKPRLRLEKFAINAAKRLLQHNRHFATHSAAIKSRPLWRRTGNERTHGLYHLDALCLALDLTVSNVVHPSTVHRQHLRRNPT
jgi:hypothetical protein